MHDVQIETPARIDITNIYLGLKAHARDPNAADEWLDGVYRVIALLADFPLRCGKAPEDEFFEEEIRHRIEGWYRILFTVHGNTVHVLHIRGERQDTLRHG